MFLMDNGPWEALQHVQLPVTQHLVNVAIGQVVVPYDPTRVWLCITGNTIWVWPNPIPGGSSGGIQIYTTQSGLPLIMSFWKDGPIVCSQWVLTGGATPTVDVATMSAGSEAQIRALSAAGARRAPARINTAPGVGGGKGLLDYWAKLVAKFGGKG